MDTTVLFSVQFLDDKEQWSVSWNIYSIYSATVRDTTCNNAKCCYNDIEATNQWQKDTAQEWKLMIALQLNDVSHLAILCFLSVFRWLLGACGIVYAFCIVFSMAKVVIFYVAWIDPQKEFQVYSNV